MLDLTSGEHQRLLSFIGYGNPAAPLRCVGAEEGLGGAMSAEEQAQNFRARCAWPQIADMREAHLTLTEGGQAIDIAEPRSGSTGVWRFMSRIALAVEGCADFNDDGQVTAYVRNRLGRRDGMTLLTEISPVPAQRSAQPTPIRAISDDLVSRLLHSRREQQLHLLRRRPGVTICFGFAKRGQFANHLEVRWQPVTPRVYRSEDGMTFLLPFFGNGQLSKADVASFVTSQEFRSALSRIRCNAAAAPDPEDANGLV